MQAVILAGGRGTRLHPYTIALPKPLVPVGDFPILEIIIRQLKYHGIEEIIICTGHLAELIEAYFKNGHRWGVKIRYVRETQPLGTAGAIKNIKNLQDNFILMNGDILTDINYQNLFNFHIAHKAIATIGVVRREILTDFGVIKIDKNAKLVSYLEKPKRFDYVSMGINVLNKKCKKYISPGEEIGIPELISRMQERNEKVYCYKSNSFWLDIGRLDDFQKAQDEFTKNKRKFLYGQY
jgi:NDP-sugar pyrophosphorylase family protein